MCARHKLAPLPHHQSRAVARMEAHADGCALTQLLAEWSGGDGDAFNRLFELVYEDLGRIAHGHLKDERAGHTLNTQALVHESYARLVNKPGTAWRDRAQFYAVASTAMRRVLVDYARRRGAEKRGGDLIRVTLADNLSSADSDLDELLTLEAGLTELAELDPRMVQVVECRFFGGLTVRETAEALQMSERTVEREWARARAHLHRRMSSPSEATSAKRDR